MRDTQRERQRHRQREQQTPRREPNAGLDPGTLGSRPEPKADAHPLSPPCAPKAPHQGHGSGHIAVTTGVIILQLINASSQQIIHLELTRCPTPITSQ